MRAAAFRTRRQALRLGVLAGLGGWLVAAPAQQPAVPASAAPAAVPAVLNTPALASPKALVAAMLAVAPAGRRLVAVGERGTVLLSDDAGAHWRQAQAVPVQVSLTAVRFMNERTGWAVGHLGVILRTDDGGEHWAKQLDGVQAAQAQAQSSGQPPEGPDKPFFDLDFSPDGQQGWAVGAYNLAFRTQDGGRSWQPAQPSLPNPKGLHLYGVRFQQGQVFIAGEQGLLLRLPSGAAGFETLASPYKGSWFGLLAARSGVLLAYGLRGNVLRSADGGEHWEPLTTGLQTSLSAGVELPGGRLALLGQTGELLLSADDGRSFSRHAPPAGTVPAAGLASASAQTPQALVLASLRGMRQHRVP